MSAVSAMLMEVWMEKARVEGLRVEGANAAAVERVAAAKIAENFMMNLFVSKGMK